MPTITFMEAMKRKQEGRCVECGSSDLNDGACPSGCFRKDGAAERLNRANAIAAVYLVFDSYPSYALTQMNDLLAGEIVDAVRQAIDPDTPLRKCATCHAVLANCPQPAATHWDEGYDEGCGPDSQRTFDKWKAEGGK